MTTPTDLPSGGTTNDPAAQGSHDRRWWALAVLVLPVLIISMDATVLGFAVPALSEELEPSSSQLLWIIDIYSFVLAALLVTMGVLGDRVGRRRLLTTGAAAFSAASVLAACSTTPEMLIASRALLGVAGATLMPSTLSLIRNIFDDAAERQRAIALWAAAFALGTAIGPIVGGALLEHFWWGSVFLVGVPVTIALVVLAPRLVPESKDPHPGPFDPLSAVLSMATMLPLVYAVKLVAEHGASITAASSLVVGVIAGTLFVRRQLSSAAPMIDVRLFSVPRFRMAVSGNLLACFGFAGTLFMVTQFLQLVVGKSPLAAGIQLLPAVLASVVAMILAPGAARRVGPFAVIASGLAIGGAGFALLSQLDVEGPLGLLTAAVVAINVGLGVAMTVAIDGILAAVAPERAGAGAAVSETANELGIALGTAILGSIMTAVYRPRIDALDVPPGAIDHARETLGAAVLTAESLPSTLGQALLDGARAAFVDGIRTASIVAAVALFAAALWAAASARRSPDVVTATAGSAH